MSITHQTVQTLDQSAWRALRTRRPTADALLPTAYCFLLALALGAAVAVCLTLPNAWAALSCLAVCGALGAAAWVALRLPLVPFLRLGLLACFSFRLEINLFPIFKNLEGPPGLTISLMLILSLLLALSRLGPWWRGEARQRVLPPAFALTLSLLFLWCSISVVYGAEKWLGCGSLFSLASISLMCFVVVSQFSDRRALREAVVFLTVMVALSCLIGLSQHYLGLFTDWKLLGAATPVERKGVEEELSRVAGLLENKNAFGWYLATFIPVLASMLLLQVAGFRRWQKHLFVVASGLAMVTLILTYARGSWVACALSMVLLVVLVYRTLPTGKRRQFARQVVALGLLLGVLCLPFASSIYYRLTEDDHGAAYSRVPLMQVAFAMIKDHPFFGVGLNSYESEMRRYDRTTEGITDEFPWPVHNIFLHMTAEAGLPATLCFLTLIGLAFWQGRQAYRRGDRFLQALALGLSVGLMAYLWTGLKELGSFGSGTLRLCFLFFGLLIAANNASRKSGAGELKP